MAPTARHAAPRASAPRRHSIGGEPSGHFSGANDSNGNHPGPRRQGLPGAARAAILIVALLLVGFLAFRGVSALLGGTGNTSSSSKSTYVSPYSWSNLSTANGRYTYSVDGVVKSKLGIDVSEAQGIIDWNAVASDGVQFAFIRLGNRGTTEGGVFLDDYFTRNLTGAQAAGIPVGVYFFSQAITENEAREEADFVVSNLAGAHLDYPVVFDAEALTGTGTTGRADKLGTSEMTAIAKAFCSEIAAAGYTPMIYGNTQDLARYNLSELQQTYKVWYAEYGDLAYTTFDFNIWQYDNSGTVAGIEGKVDMDIDLSGAL